MTVELYFSNQLDQLALKLSDVMAVEVREKSNIFDPPVVIVPNANLAKWLQLFLAGRNSVFMNVRFQYLEEGLWEMLAARDPAADRPEMLDNDQRNILLLHALEHLDRNDADYLPVARYLTGKGGEDRPDRAARLWQLSEKLAHLFKEYEFHRTDTVRAWMDDAPEPTAMGRCQKRLYRQVQAVKGEMERRTGKRLVSLLEYAGLHFARSRLESGQAAPRGAVHFFGLSQISNFHLTLIGRLQAGIAVHLYTMNPSREFWEDIRTPGERRWIRRKNVSALAIGTPEREQGELHGEADHPLLAAWGKPGRENIRLLCELTGYDFHACFAPPKSPDTVLLRIQNDILTLSGADRHAARLPQDRSLQVLACPGVYREVETVYYSILSNLDRDDTLQLTDVAVLVPDMSVYKPVFDSVFNRHPRQLAYNLVDSNAQIESVYGNAVLSLLQLAKGRFTRKAVFDLMLNPCFMDRWRIDPDTVHVWAEWARSLNIFHTYEGSVDTGDGPAAGARFTWKQGLQRLRLSRIMAAPEVDDPEGFAHYRELIPFSDIHTGDANRIETFCSVIETLHRCVRALHGGSAGGEQWKRRFFQACDPLFRIPDGLKGESEVRRALVRAFDHLRLHDRLQDPEEPQPSLDLELIAEFIRANLGAISGGYGNYLTGGVTLSALQPMRPIPFRIVYVLGMEEGGFPGKADLSSLDLRLSRRRIGDISLPERNRYLFLEMLVSVREKLYIGFVARDLQKDRLRQPCSVVNQLKRYVEQEILPPGEPFRVSEIPLSGSSERCGDSEAASDWSDVRGHASTADRVAWLRSRGVWEAFRRSAPASDLDKAARFDPDLSFPAAAADPLRTGPSLAVPQLRHFLMDPVRFSVRRHLGLAHEAESIEDVVLAEDEPFYSVFPMDYRLKMEPLQRWLDAWFAADGEKGSPPDPDVLCERVYEDNRRRGRTPEGAFAEIDRETIHTHVRQYVDTLLPVLSDMQAAKQLFRAVNIGEAPGEIFFGSRLPQRQFPAVALFPEPPGSGTENSEMPAALHGSLPWVWQDGCGDWHALVLTGSGTRPKAPDRYVLGPVLCCLLCMAGDESRQWMGGGRLTLHLVYQETVRTWTYRPGREAAACYLARLVADAMDPSVASWLPFEIATALSVRPHRMHEGEVNDAVRERYAEELEEAFAETEDDLARIVKPTVPPDAFDRARGRFGVFFDTVEEGAPGQ